MWESPALTTIGGMRNSTFADQIHEIWRTRPVRLPDKGPIAGVAAGIAYRYGVDAVLIRVAFVVATIFGGAGIVLYLAGWLFLNQVGDESSAAESLFGKGRSSESHTKAIVLVVALAIALSTMGPIGLGLGGSGLISTALLLGGWWLLHQRSPVPPPLPAGHLPVAPITGYPGTGYVTGRFNPAAAESVFTDHYSPYTRLPDRYVPDAPADDPVADTPADVVPPSAGPSLTKQTSVETPSQTTTFGVQGMPPSWDPLGVAPFAWDLPEPTGAVAAPERLARPRPRSRLTSVVLGVAILAAAGTSAAAFAGADWLSPGRIGAISLAVIGLGLILGAFLRRGYGLLVVTGPLIAFVVIASLLGPVDFDSATLGDKQWKPTTVADLQSDYSVLLGSGNLDLRDLDLSENKTIDIDAQLAELKVQLPANLDVHKTSTIFAGEVTGIPDGTDGGADGTKGPVLTLNIKTRLGSVEVHRG